MCNFWNPKKDRFPRKLTKIPWKNLHIPLEMVPGFRWHSGPTLFLAWNLEENPPLPVSSDQFTPVGCFILGIIWLSKIPIEDCNKPLLRIPILHIGIFYWKSPLMFFFWWFLYGFHLGTSPLFTTREPSFSSGFVSLSWKKSNKTKRLNYSWWKKTSG